VWRSTSGYSVMNRHRHAIEQASRRWRGGRRDEYARQNFDFHTGVDGEPSQAEAVHFVVCRLRASVARCWLARRLGHRVAVLASASTTKVRVARKRARGAESRRSRRQACRALCYAFVGVTAASRARFCCVLAPIGFLPLSARDGPRFAAGFARRGDGLPSLGFCEFRARIRRFERCCTGQIGKFTGQIRNHGFFD